MSPLDADDQINGQVPLDSRYVLQERVGYSNHAEVCRGRDLNTGETVAVKRRRRDPITEFPGIDDLIRQEGQVLRELEHPNIVKLLDPETCMGETVDGRSDIWSLGIILYEMLAGRPPFIESQVTAVLISIMSNPPPDITRYRLSLPQALSDLLYQMLSKDPAQSPSTIRRVAAELEAIRAHL